MLITLLKYYFSLSPGFNSIKIKTDRFYYILIKTKPRKGRHDELAIVCVQNLDNEQKQERIKNVYFVSYVDK